MKALVWIENLYHKLRGRSFRGFVHPPEAMIALLAQAGFYVLADHRSFVWRTVLVARGERLL